MERVAEGWGGGRGDDEKVGSSRLSAVRDPAATTHARATPPRPAWGLTGHTSMHACDDAPAPAPAPHPAAEHAFAGAGVRGWQAGRRARTAPCVAELRPGSPGRGIVDGAGPGQNSGRAGGGSVQRASAGVVSVERCQLSELVWRPCLTAPG
eukprot:COSAG01_NODE_1694_length_9467_cov_4.976196_5_plen_152_part_00